MKTFGALVAVATIAGSLTATPVGAQHGVAAPAAIISPTLMDQVGGHTTISAVANGCNSVSMTAMAGVSAECESAADPRLRRG